MAVAVIGGLITSTFLSLLVIPSVFTLFDDLGQLIGRLRRKIFGHSMAHTAPAMPHPEPAPIAVRAKTSPTEPLWK